MALPALQNDERPVVIALMRVSTEGQAAEDRGGIPRQRASIIRTIEANSLNCIKWYELHVSGTSVTETPEMKEILLPHLVAEHQQTNSKIDLHQLQIHQTVEAKRENFSFHLCCHFSFQLQHDGCNQ